MMPWYSTLVIAFVVTDAGLLLLGGLVVATLLLFGKQVDHLIERGGSALGVLIVSNIGASLLLGAAKWLLS